MYSNSNKHKTRQIHEEKYLGKVPVLFHTRSRLFLLVVALLSLARKYAPNALAFSLKLRNVTSETWLI